MAAVPQHIAIIMDGNGRWAKQHHVARLQGHNKGAEVFQTITRHCQKIGVKALTVFAFSTENWSRSKEEVDALMGLFRRYLVDAFNYEEENFRIHFIGRRDRLSQDLLSRMTEIEEKSASNDGLILNIAIDYGGRDEIVHVARRLASLVSEGKLSVSDIDENTFNQYLFTADSPPVDFILRPSGEQRISNFLLWQSAYAEFIYMDTLWPDFTPELLDEAISRFQLRDRRYGGRKES